MNSKSRNTYTVCGPFTLSNISNNKFLEKYYKEITRYVTDDVPGEIPKDSNVEDLKHLAEQEFTDYYNTVPSCAVFAPGCLTIAGEVKDIAESKSLSMAVQLVTVIVGKHSYGSKWCHVKTLSNEVNGQNAFKFHLNAVKLDKSEEPLWIRCVKGTLQSFKGKREHVPGFKIVIVSNVPIKCGLGSSSALIVAVYTFLEAITHTYTTNVFEKTLACHLAKKLATGLFDVRISDILMSIIGCENKIFAFDARSVRVDERDWNPANVHLIFIETAGIKIESSNLRPNAFQRKEISNLWNTSSRWRAHSDGTSMMHLLFSQNATDATKYIADEDKRMMKMMNILLREGWEELGKLLWESYYSTRKYLSFTSTDIDSLITRFEAVEGVLGAKIVRCERNASLVVLVQRSSLKTFIHILNDSKNMWHRYYMMKPSIGASVLYTYKDQLLSRYDRKPYSYRGKLTSKYYHCNENELNMENYNVFVSSKSISLFIPGGKFID